MRWYFQIRGSEPERAPSRVLQVLETQRLLPQQFEATQCRSAMHLRFLVEGTEAQAYRIGWLLRRLPVVASAYWLAAYDEEDEHRLWNCTALSAWAPRESSIDLDPESDWWHAAPSVTLLANNVGVRVPAHATEVRLRWTKNNLYLLFDGGYDHLSLAPGRPMLDAPTPALWEHDVVEVFLGVNESSFERYMEFEVSPRGEWIDLDIAAREGSVSHRAPLQSGFQAAARVDHENKRWLTFLRIPSKEQQATGKEDLRLNLFRSQGPGPVELAWQPTYQDSFHVPRSFGYLRFIAS